MTRPATHGFQKPLDSGKRREVGLAVVTYERGETLLAAECSCGWMCWHNREKVVENRIDAHLAKKHGGRGLRL